MSVAKDASFTNLETRLWSAEVVDLERRIADVERFVSTEFATLENRMTTLNTDVVDLESRVIDVVILGPLVGPSTTYDLAPRHNKTVYSVPPYTTNGVDLHVYFVVDNTSAQVGYEMQLLFRNEITQNNTKVYVHFSTPTFWFAQCSDLVPIFQMTVPYNVFAPSFIFDGISWNCTGDNC